MATNLNKDAVFGETINEQDPASTLSPTDSFLVDQNGTTRKASLAQVQEGFLTDDELAIHTSNTGNPHSVTPSQLGVYTTQQATTAINSAVAASAATQSANLASHVSATNPHGIIPSTINAYTTGQVNTRIADAVDALLVSPAFSGTPTAPNRSITSINTSIATTKFVSDFVSDRLGNRRRLKVALTANQSIPGDAWSVCKYNQVVEDASSAYNPSTGVWTCPESGEYRFEFSQEIYWENTAQGGNTASFFGSAIVVAGERYQTHFHYVSDIISVSDGFSTVKTLSITQGQTVTIQGFVGPSTLSRFVGDSKKTSLFIEKRI